MNKIILREKYIHQQVMEVGIVQIDYLALIVKYLDQLSETELMRVYRFIEVIIQRKG